MKLLPSKDRLLPRTHIFWSLFAIETDLVTGATQLLVDALQGGGSFEPLAAELKTIEQKSKENLEEIQQNLCKTFITPIDPEDISMLGEQLDCTCRELEAIAYRLAAYGITPIPPGVVSLAETSNQCAELLKSAFLAFSKRTTVDEPCHKVSNIGEQQRRLVREGVVALFARQREPATLMKTRELYEKFENLGESFKRVAVSLRNVALKNA